MMRKMLILFLILFLLSLSVFAAEYTYTATGYFTDDMLPQNTALKAGDTIGINLPVNCLINEIPPYIRIGFLHSTNASNVVNSTDISDYIAINSNVTLKTISMTDPDGEGYASSEEFYLFYAIVSTANLKVSLSTRFPLQGESYHQKLDWSASATVDGETVIADSAADITSALVATHEAETRFTSCGSIPLTVSTKPYHTVGVDNYYGYLYLNVENAG